MPLTVHEVTPDDPDFLALQAEATVPPERCLVARRAGRPAARASLSLAHDLHGAEGTTGMVGHFEARDGEAGVAVLRAAVDRLAEQGARRVLGPMDGSTWARYRLALASPEPPFFSEPRNPPEYLDWFAAAGFVEDAHYESRVAEDLGGDPAFLGRLEARLAREGFRERPLDPARPDEELALLHAASLEAFADNLYYRPIPRAGFVAQYRPLLPRLDPHLVRLVESPDGSLAAYVLAFEDFLAPRGERLVLKTLAAAPRWRNRGLGSFLTARIHSLAREKGYRAVIHALMHVDNPSVRISGRVSGPAGRLVRRYVLLRHDLS